MERGFEFKTPRTFEENFMSDSSVEVKRALCDKFGSEITNNKKLIGEQSYKLEDGMIVSVDFDLLRIKSGYQDENPIIVQTEKGAKSYETTWENLDKELKAEILKQIV